MNSIVRFIKKNLFLCILYSFYAVGIIGHIINITFPYMITLTPYVLLVFGIVVLYRSTRFDRKLLLWCLGTYICTFLVEALGVYTGVIFGSYYYGNTLGIQLFDVPLVIGFNWVLVVLGAISLAQRFIRSDVLSSIAAGALTALFDIPLEIVAVHLDYWHWERAAVPLQNYVAWFCVAFVAAFVFNRSKMKPKSTVAIHYFFVQLFFFIVIDVFIFLGVILSVRY